MSRRVLSALGGTLSLTLVLAACGGSDDSPDAGADPADFEGVELTMWHGVPYDPFMTLNREQLEQCAEDLGVTIAVEDFTADQLAQQVLQAGSAGDLPEILMVNSATIGELASSGFLADLSAFGLEPEGLDESTEQMGYRDGTLYGIATHVELAALEYRPDLFEEAGLEPPTTFEELREVAAELTTEDRYGIALPGDASGDAGSFFLLPFILSAGGDPADFSDPGTIAALQLYQDLVEDGSMSSEMVNWGWDFQDQFNGGLAAMTMNGPWAGSPQSQDYENAPREFAPTPVLDSSHEPRSGVTGNLWTVTTGHDDTVSAAAAAVLDCRIAPENQLEIAEVQYYLPAHQDAASDFSELDPVIAPFVDGIAGAYDQAAELDDDWRAVGTRLGSAIDYVVVEGMSPEEALERAAGE
ncbi:sugar ABC transporter substrate-binding protein [Bogoriella caseilytica]|uniref:Carbohydrate ABC transporter substrate-binding protein (CUT1 family) n=1 Tax=Bogoriella caseilytica TaxID=56055 RepID=A0A3N2BFF9_9MICO|nr:extracellular solute-binding protein [Bogoriella caseilytica]ROR73950.1 carbohydrate ABC transporter substrate-binding protein (CUT1 family) [Bogoriella caseilytica]